MKLLDGFYSEMGREGEVVAKWGDAILAEIVLVVEHDAVQLQFAGGSLGVDVQNLIGGLAVYGPAAGGAVGLDVGIAHGGILSVPLLLNPSIGDGGVSGLAYDIYNL